MLDFPAAEFFYESPDTAVEEVVPQGKLIPAAEQSFNHSARVCRIGPDNKLYIALGQPYNVPPKAKMPLYNQWGMGGIVRMDRDGKNREVFAASALPAPFGAGVVRYYSDKRATLSDQTSPFGRMLP